MTRRPTVRARGGAVIAVAALLGVQLLALVGVLGASIVPAAADPALCATPAKDGSGVITGIVNTYYPGRGNPAIGATTISLGTARGSGTAIAKGDLLLVIQMQSGQINSNNTINYGDGQGHASGWTGFSPAMDYEYVVANGAVAANGRVSITGTGTGGGLLHQYRTAAASGNSGQLTFQVVRVPQYLNISLGANLTASPWNGATGGILAIDVAGTLGAASGTADVSGLGFRGAYGEQLQGDNGTNTDYVVDTSQADDGGKGEGVVGTPRYLLDPATGNEIDAGNDGYPAGDMARGAPGTAGGGGTDGHPSANDQNSGGAGGANGGAGGHGGHSWSSNLDVGGVGGTAFPSAAASVVLGSGGGAGTRNDDDAKPLASSGAAGGGLLMLRVGATSGTGGSFLANGTTAYNDTDNDAGGGGGAGGTIMVTGHSLTALSASATGGRGGDSWHTASGTGFPANRHGPGGGGGGGAVLESTTTLATTVTGGANGITTAANDAYGATSGGNGTVQTILPTAIPGAASGADCLADMAITNTGPASVAAGGSVTYQVGVTNNGGSTATGVSWTETIPANTVFASLTAPAGWTCAMPAVGSSGQVTCTAGASVAPGASAGFTLVLTVTATTATTLTSTATVASTSPTDPITTNNTATATTTVVNLGVPLADAKVGGLTAVALWSAMGGGWLWLRRRRREPARVR
jgi:uncharacterized repeat protein (TIGR01451 family)